MNQPAMTAAQRASPQIQAALSAVRLESYAAHDALGDIVRSLSRYRWDARVAGSFLWPLQVCEVSLRNAIAQAISLAFEADWINAPTFLRMLPDDMESMLNDAKRKAAGSADKTIAELSFGFWRNMLTSRFDNHIWSHHWRAAFPNTANFIQLEVARNNLHKQVSQVKKLRDRIAHHKPIWLRDLARDLATITRIIGFRCEETQAWMSESETVTQALAVPMP